MTREIVAKPREIAAKSRQPDPPDAPPPLLGSWRNLYVVLLVELAALVAGFAALTWWAS